MNKKLLFGLTIALIFFSYIFNVDQKISKKFSAFSINIQNLYIKNLVSIENSFTKYFNQSKQINKLQEEILENEEYKVLYSQIKQNKTADKNTTLQRLRVISYIDFNDFSKITLQSTKNQKNISSLITKNGFSAGIISYENNISVGYLNHHPKCSYAIFIGENKIPGITHGIKNNKNILIKFIPLWETINIGDEVITSGMDNIFSKGVKVGKILSIKRLSDTQEAIVEPYANVYNTNYFYTQ